MLQLGAHDGPTWPSEASGGSGGGNDNTHSYDHERTRDQKKGKMISKNILKTFCIVLNLHYHVPFENTGILSLHFDNYSISGQVLSIFLQFPLMYINYFICIL